MWAVLNGNELGVGDICLHPRGVAIWNHSVGRALCGCVRIVRSVTIEILTLRIEVETYPDGEDGSIRLARMSTKRRKLWRETA